MSDDQAEPQETERLRDGLKRVAVALKEVDVPFALEGGYAAWSHGSPEPLHDVDFLIRAEDAARVAQGLRRREFEVVLAAAQEAPVLDLLERLDVIAPARR